MVDTNIIRLIIYVILVSDNRTVDDLVQEAEEFHKPQAEAKRKVFSLKPAVSFDQEPPQG